MALNFPFPQDSSVAVPFNISVDEAFVAESVLKAGLYRPSIDLLDDSNANWIEGPPAANMTALAQYWATDYDWSTEEDYINGNFSHFAIIVPETPLYSHPVPLHFIHERSDDDDALPLLILHGWPSTSLEWQKVIPLLTSSSPNETDSPSFHVVAPDLPGFGFSPAPKYDGLSPQALAEIFDTLMSQLGYDRYGIVGTDAGWWITMWMADLVAEGRIVGHFTDFFIVPPSESDLERYANNETTLEETRYISSSLEWYNEHSGYQQVQDMQPLAAGQAFADSPVGWAGWVWHLLFSASDDYPYTFDEIITTAFTLFIQQPYATMRYYRLFFSPEGQGYSKSLVPTGVSQWGMGSENSPFPGLRYFNYIPRDWLERLADVRELYRHERGGHFPALNLPQDWVADVAHFFSIYR